VNEFDLAACRFGLISWLALPWIVVYELREPPAPPVVRAPLPWRSVIVGELPVAGP
jgi:hypothetical protein